MSCHSQHAGHVDEVVDDDGVISGSSKNALPPHGRELRMQMPDARHLQEGGGASCACVCVSVCVCLCVCVSVCLCVCLSVFVRLTHIHSHTFVLLSPTHASHLLAQCSDHQLQ